MLIGKYEWKGIYQNNVWSLTWSSQVNGAKLWANVDKRRWKTPIEFETNNLKSFC